MKKKLQEGYIKKKALQFLCQEYYQRCPVNGVIYKELEAYTREGKRADGLIIFKQKGPNPFVSSLEAKSANTVRSLVEQMDLARIVDDGLKMAVLSFAFLWCLAWMAGVRQMLDPTLALLMGGCWIWMVKSYIAAVQPLALRRHARIGALDQLKQYPADERWLAIGSDSLTQDEAFRRLVRHCRKAGIGLLVISAKGEVEVRLHPRFSTRSDVTDYTAFYKNAPLALQRIKKAKKQTGFGKATPAQSSYRLQLYSIASASILFCVLFFFPPPLDYQQVAQQQTFSYRPQSTRYQPDLPKQQLEKQNLPQPALQHNIHCNYLTFHGRRLLLVDQFLSTEAAATERVALLQAIGFHRANYFWLPCYKNSQDQALFCVHPYDPRTSDDRIAHQKRRYNYLTELHEIEAETPQVIWIERPN